MPSKDFISQIGVKSINLGNYKWDYNKQAKIIKKELGWKTDELEECLIKLIRLVRKYNIIYQGSEIILNL